MAPALLLVALSALAGCGGDSADTAADPATDQETSASDSPSGEETADVPAGTPDCSEVWADGNRIARAYRGCVDDSGGFVPREAVGCSSGQRMVTYADRFYGVLGGTVREAAEPLDDDRDFQAAMRRCSA